MVFSIGYEELYDLMQDGKTIIFNVNKCIDKKIDEIKVSNFRKTLTFIDNIKINEQYDIILSKKGLFDLIRNGETNIYDRSGKVVEKIVVVDE